METRMHKYKALRDSLRKENIEHALETEEIGEVGEIKLADVITLIKESRKVTPITRG